MPSSRQISNILGSLDLAFKSEILLCDLAANFYWISIFENSLVILGIVLMLTSFGKVGGFIIFHIIHSLRGFVGIIILKMIPRSHDIIAKIEINENQVSLKDIESLVRLKINVAFSTYVESSKNILCCYSIITQIAMIFDTIDFFI